MQQNEIPSTAAEIVRELGPFAPGGTVHGVSHDGRHVWAALGETIVALDPESGAVTRTIDHAGDAGTAFDGTHLWQIAESRIDKIDPATGAVLASIPAPGQGADSGLAWGEGSLWVGQYRGRRIHQVDPATGLDVGSYTGLNAPYTYSDMTGYALGNVICPPEG